MSEPNNSSEVPRGTICTTMYTRMKTPPPAAAAEKCKENPVKKSQLSKDDSYSKDENVFFFSFIRWYMEKKKS